MKKAWRLLARRKRVGRRGTTVIVAVARASRLRGAPAA
jgi:hypothetical protein